MVLLECNVPRIRNRADTLSLSPSWYPGQGGETTVKEMLCLCHAVPCSKWWKEIEEEGKEEEVEGDAH